MNKDITIGVLVAALVIVGGYFLLKSNKVEVTVTPAPVVTNTPVTPTPTPTTPVDTVTPAAPTVTTSQTAVPSSSSVVLTGTVKPNGASTTYWFDYGETTSFGTQSSQQAIGSGYSSISAPAYITGLKANTLYSYRLSAKNRFATVNGATFTFTTNNNPPPTSHVAPTTHTGAASSISRTAANLNGTINPNGFDTNYWFEYGTDQSLGNVTDVQPAGNSTSIRSISMSISNLNPLTTYYFRLNGQNEYGTINGAIMSFKTTGPIAPSSPTANTTGPSVVKTSSVTLNGTVNPNGAETTYWFEYSQDSLFGTLIGSGTPQTTVPGGTTLVRVSAAVNGLSPNTAYFYRVVARNSEGTTTGNSVTFKTKS